METNSKKVLAALPSFEDYLAIAEEIKKIYLNKMIVENAIKSEEAENFKEVMSNPKFWVDGKRPTVSYYESAYKWDGIDNNLRSIRTQLADLQSQLDLKRNQLEIYKQMHDLFKTLVYQEKSM